MRLWRSRKREVLAFLRWNTTARNVRARQACAIYGNIIFEQSMLHYHTTALPPLAVPSSRPFALGDAASFSSSSSSVATLRAPSRNFFFWLLLLLLFVPFFDFFAGPSSSPRISSVSLSINDLPLRRTPK